MGVHLQAVGTQQAEGPYPPAGLQGARPVVELALEEVSLPVPHLQKQKRKLRTVGLEPKILGAGDLVANPEPLEASLVPMRAGQGEGPGQAVEGAVGAGGQGAPTQGAGRHACPARVTDAVTVDALPHRGLHRVHAHGALQQRQVPQIVHYRLLQIRWEIRVPGK